MEEPTCLKCSAAAGPERSMLRCPICFRYTCDKCVLTRGGRSFCSVHCADLYFFGDEEQ